MHGLAASCKPDHRLLHTTNPGGKGLFSCYVWLTPLVVGAFDVQVEAQLYFFSQQLLPHSVAASQACSAAAAGNPLSSSAQTGSGSSCQVVLSMLRSYKLPGTAPGLCRADGLTVYCLH